MSVRENAEEAWGVIFTDKMMAEAIKHRKKKYTEDEYYLFANEIGLDELFSFSGQALPVGEDGATDWSQESLYFNSEHIYYASLRNWSTLLKPAYSSMSEIVAEMKENFGKYLPINYDYAHSIKHFVGTYYG